MDLKHTSAQLARGLKTLGNHLKSEMVTLSMSQGKCRFRSYSFHLFRTISDDFKFTS